MTRKKFEVPDSGLWEEMKATIQPLRGFKRVKSKLDWKVAAPLQFAHMQQKQPETHIQRLLRTGPPPLADFDRRTSQKLGRGQLRPEISIDLHGENLSDARYQLLHFLSTQRIHGHRLVLVITGKGASPFARHTLHGKKHFDAPEREGKLRREVPLWLEEAQFRIHVVGFQPAHPRHGGGGAFYVKLRKHE